MHSFIPWRGDGRWSEIVFASPLASGLIAALGVSAFYDAYRYPLRISDSGSGSAYADTPLWLSGGKYSVLLCLTAVTFLWLRARHVSLHVGLREALLACLTLWCVVAGGWHVLQVQSVLPIRAEAGLLCVAPLALLVGAARSPASLRAATGRACLDLATGLVLLHATADAVEVVLWLVFGRLPSHGYAHALVRFGGIWDDPNSAGAFAALFLALLASNRARGYLRHRRALALCAVGVLLLSWSFSADIIMAVSVCAAFGLRTLGRKKAFMGLLCAGVAALVLGTLAVAAYGHLPDRGGWFQQKVASSFGARRNELERGGYLDAWPRSPGEWLVGRDTAGVNESALNWWLNTTGLPGMVLLVAWLALCLRAVWRGAERVWLTSAFAGLLTGSLFVPSLLVFPLSAFTVLTLTAVATMTDVVRGAAVASLS